MKKQVFLGIDVGSSSLKFAITDRKRNLIDYVYLRNQGLIETMKIGLKRIAKDSYEIKGVGITGSGRAFLEKLIGADLVKTEILAHAFGTLHYYPNVKTLLDIGAEDSKAIFLNDGIIEDFVMNQSCSAGTSSLLEAIATRIGIRIEDVGKLALKSKKKLNISTKCGIFMQSAVITYLNSGAKKEDILMGVIRGMVGNYLTMMQGKDIKPPYVFQGATAKNCAVVYVLKEKLKSDIVVPEHPEVMGAIGMSFLVNMENPKKTKFKGFKLVNHNFTTRIRTCKDCENNCELNEIYEDKKLIGTLNSRCGKYS